MNPALHPAAPLGVTAPLPARRPSDWLGAALGSRDFSADLMPPLGSGLAGRRALSGWPGGLGVWAAAWLVGLAWINNASLHGAGWASAALFAALLALMVPFIVRLLLPQIGEPERVATLIVLGLTLFLVRMLNNPVAFVSHDEFLHWRSTDDILATGRLFTPNPLLPIGPEYPGLAALTAALVQVSGLSVFAAGVLVIGAARVVFTVSSYAFFRALSGRGDIAAVATLVCMASSNFVFFHAQFAYESLAIALVMLCLALVMEIDTEDRRAQLRPVHIGGLALPLAALVLTHHLSAYYLIGVLAMVSLCYAVIERDLHRTRRLATLTALAAILSLAWQYAFVTRTGSYLAPIIEQATNRLEQIAHTGSLGRQLFVSQAGDVMPLWQRLTAIGAVLLVGLGLLTGSARTWRLCVGHGARPWLATMLLLAWLYPLCVALRLENTTWEIGNRLGSYVFPAVAFVIAHAVVGLWLAGSRHPLRLAGVTAALGVLLLGGMIAGGGPFAQPGPYRVGGENRAIDAQGIDAARWSGEQLGPGHRFAADRTNRLLVTVYGRQRPVTTLYDHLDLSPLFLQPRLGPEQQALIEQAGLDYLLVDLRLSGALPFVGHYYEIHEMPGGHQHPASFGALNKFDGMAGVDRLYDSGDIAIYDVRRLDGQR